MSNFQYLENGNFWSSKIPEIDFTENMNGTIFLKFQHCDKKEKNK